MKKRIFLLCMITFLGMSVLRAQTFQQGTAVADINISIGGSFVATGYSLSIPVGVTFDYGIKDKIIGGDKGAIGVGGEFIYASSSYSYFGYTAKYSYYLFDARGTFHYPLVDKLDTYGGLKLGLSIASFSSNVPSDLDYNESSSTSVVGGLFVGARYYFTNNISVVGELATSIVYLKLGIAYKFN